MRVRSIYVGTGEMAQLECSVLSMQQKERGIQQSKLAAEKTAFQECDANLDSIEGVVSTIVEAVMISEGFHQHRGQWRKRRLWAP